MNLKNYYYINNLKLKKIRYGFFKNKIRFSKNKYKPLNCSIIGGENIINIKKNISTALNSLNLEEKIIKIPNQQHTSLIKKITSNNINKKILADGLYTKEKKIALAVLTADCTPIFLFDNNEKIICVLHSGWKGTLKNIAKKSIGIFLKNNIKIKNITVIIGPCLAFRNFEVTSDFKNKFIKKNINYIKFFRIKNKQKDFFDMRGLINFQFKSLGVLKIYNVRKDTYKNSSIFYSHRRSKHINKSKKGRMINIIGFK